MTDPEHMNGVPREPQSERPGQVELTASVRERLPAHDPQALGVFFDAFFGRVYGYVCRLVRDEHLSEDLTQEIFLHIYRALPSYDPARDLRPWVFAIATNKVRDFWRSRRHRDAQTETSVERDGAADHVALPGDAPESSAMAQELDAKVRAAVDELPEGMRLTVLLRAYEGLSFEEVGRVLNRNEVAVRKRYSRALDVLRASLGATYRTFMEGT